MSYLFAKNEGVNILDLNLLEKRSPPSNVFKNKIETI